jgi:hypothetical protein
VQHWFCGDLFPLLIGCVCVFQAMETTEAIEFMDDFFLTSGGRRPSLMELPFAIQEIQWERSQAEKVYAQGKSDGLQEVSVEIDLWRLELPLEGKPKFLVHQVAGGWYVHGSSSHVEAMCLLVLQGCNPRVVGDAFLCAHVGWSFGNRVIFTWRP